MLSFRGALLHLEGLGCYCLRVVDWVFSGKAFCSDGCPLVLYLLGPLSTPEKVW